MFTTMAFNLEGITDPNGGTQQVLSVQLSVQMQHTLAWTGFGQLNLTSSTFSRFPTIF